MSSAAARSTVAESAGVVSARDAVAHIAASNTASSRPAERGLLFISRYKDVPKDQAVCSGRASRMLACAGREPVIADIAQIMHNRRVELLRL
jgi:hypothetical protein